MYHNKQNEAKTNRKQPTIGFSPLDGYFSHYPKISVNAKKVAREKNVLNKSCRQFYVIGAEFFFILTKSQKCWSDSQKCLAKYWPN